MLSNEAIKNMKDRTRLLLMTQKKTQVSVSKLVARSEGIPNLISKWFSTHYHLSLGHAILLAEALDISPDYLFLGIGVPQRKSELYEPLFTQDEIEMLSAYQGMTVEEKSVLLHTMKSQIPANAFCSEAFLSGNKEQMNHNMEDWMHFIGRKLKEHIKAKKLTQRAVAKATGIDSSNIARYIAGEREISVANFILICKYLEIYPTDLLFYYCNPQKIEGLPCDASDMIAYYRMMNSEQKGEFLALAKCRQEMYQ